MQPTRKLEHAQMGQTGVEERTEEQGQAEEEMLQQSLRKNLLFNTEAEDDEEQVRLNQTGL